MCVCLLVSLLPRLLARSIEIDVDIERQLGPPLFASTLSLLVCSVACYFVGLNL